MSFPAYPSYQDSGIDWAGEVPSHWDITALKRFLNMQSGTSITADSIGEDGAYPVFGGNGLRGHTSSFTHAGEYALIGRQGALCGNVNYASGKFWASEHAIVCTPNKPVALTWLGELLRAMNLNRHSTSAAQPGISVEMIRELLVPIPPHDEQVAIATFLDRETAKIDDLIAEQQRLIDLLKEKRQAVISHAVTKGLNPDALMKDSGIGWLGEVPAHWTVLRLKNACSDSKAGPFGSALTKDMYESQGYRVYGQEQVIPADFTIGDYYINATTYEELKQYSVKSGDILISCVGSFGRVAVVPENVEPGIINPRLIRLRANSNHHPDYLAVLLRSQPVFEQFSFLSRGGTMDVINLGTLNSIVVAAPPGDEQLAILNFIKREVESYERLIGHAETSTNLLQERRSALISAAVTGKIDVRGIVSAEAEAA